MNFIYSIITKKFDDAIPFIDYKKVRTNNTKIEGGSSPSSTTTSKNEAH
jgi:hypothetical protein